VKVKATLPSGVSTSHTSTVSVTADNNYNNAVATGSATVNLSKAGSISYVNGSTELLDTNGGKIGDNLADTILTSGVNIGDVAVSLNNMRFVQFKAKMNCEEVKNIQVCELATKKIITIKETDFDASKHSKNLDDCKEEVKYIKVCELSTKKIVTIKESDFDASKYSKDLDDCKEVVKINVCELSTKKIITIDEKDFDSKKHSKNLEDCVVPGEIVVCEIATKNVVKIKENEFDDSKYTKDLSKCETVTPPVTELPKTGISGNVIAAIASLVTLAAGYAVTSRKNVLG
jgi:LPXTG-motif cell wall-anchored protein